MKNPHKLKGSKESVQSTSQERYGCLLNNDCTTYIRMTLGYILHIICLSNLRLTKVVTIDFTSSDSC